MALRMIEVIIPEARAAQTCQALDEPSVIGVWQSTLAGNLISLRVLVEQGKSGAVTDRLETHLAGTEGYRRNR